MLLPEKYQNCQHVYIGNDKKYCLVKLPNTQIIALRYNQDWREFQIGDNLLGRLFSLADLHKDEYNISSLSQT